MSEFITFSARIEPMVWGMATCTILRLPPDVAQVLATAKRVEGEINDHPINLAPTRAPVVEGPLLWTGQNLPGRIGVAPGEEVEVRLRPAPNDGVDLPDDIAAAVVAAGVLVNWEGLTPGRKRGLIYQIDTAKTPATRARRIAALIETLTG